LLFLSFFTGAARGSFKSAGERLSLLSGGAALRRRRGAVDLFVLLLRTSANGCVAG